MTTTQNDEDGFEFTFEAESERDFASELQELIEEASGYDNGVHVSTFDDVGMLTYNKGLVIRLANGAEFQVTIVQSQHPAESDDPYEDEDES